MPLGRPRNEAEKAVDAAHARRRRAARREALEEAKNATDPTPEQQETLRIVREKLEKDVGRKTASRQRQREENESGTDIDAEGESVSEEALTDSDVDAEGEYDSELDAEGEWDPDHEPEQGPTHQMQHSFAKLRLGLRQSQIYRQSHTRHRSLF
ncbi:hypothetical protein JCM16303_000519 [Sporobolomyces ruberrimus]